MTAAGSFRLAEASYVTIPPSYSHDKIATMVRKIGDISFEPNSRPKPFELETAYVLVKSGLDVTFLSYKADGKNADIRFDRLIWEIKTPLGCGRRTIENLLRKAKSQSENIIFDIRRTKLSVKEVENEIIRQSKKAHSFRRIILITKRGGIHHLDI